MLDARQNNLSIIHILHSSAELPVICLVYILYSPLCRRLLIIATASKPIRPLYEMTAAP